MSGEIRDEMQFHVEMRAEDYARQGVAADEARRAALRRFGNLALMQDRGYDVRGGGVMETILQDIRFGARVLAKQRGFSLVALLTLALGIGVSTALFSVMDSALIRPLPYPQPEQLVDVRVAIQTSPSPGDTARSPDGTPMTPEPESLVAPSMADLRAWRAADTVFSHVGMGRNFAWPPLIVDAGEPERLTVGLATDDFLEAYGIQPFLGRTFQFADTRDGAPAVALLGHAYWRSRFSADPEVLGRTIRVQDTPRTIVGVLPAGFFPGTSVWTARRDPSLRNRGSGIPAVGRLRPGVSIPQAEKLLSALSPAVGSDGKPAEVHVRLRSLYEDATSDYRSTLGILTSAVALILLIACVNVAGLLLARGAARESELAVRASLGASRGRLVRQLLTESLILASVSAVVGCAVAWASLDALVAILPLSLPENAPPTINLTVLGFTVGLSIISALSFGLLPAIRLSRVRLGAHLAYAGRRAGAPLTRRGGQWLIGVQVALALILLTGSGLLVRSFARLVSVDLGFDPRAVLTMEVQPVEQTPAARMTFYPALVTALESLPEVAAVGAIDDVTLSGGSAFGRLRPDTGEPFSGNLKWILPGYFESLGVQPTLGRLPVRGAEEGEAVITQEAVARFYKNTSPLGQVFMSNVTLTTTRRLRIVGVVPNVRHLGPEMGAQPTFYLTAGDGDMLALGMVLRFHPGASVSPDRLRQVAAAVGPKVVIGRIRSATDLLDQQVATPRHRMMLLALLGGFGLILTVVGIVSVTAYAVARRTREIGVRMAFGARPVDVVWRIVRDAAWPVAFGLAAGLAGAFYATRIIESFLFEIPARDPLTFAAVAVLMAVAACLAAWIPARSAARVDPVTALRSE